MTIKSPSAIDTFEIGPGDMYFIPAGYPHHIENLGTDELHFLVFFDRAMPQDIGYTGGIPAFPRRIVAPTLGMTVATLPRLIMGSLLIENFFGIPGLGNLLVMAIGTSDQPVVLACTYLGSLLYIGGLILTDVCYALADPRIRLS